MTQIRGFIQKFDEQYFVGYTPEQHQKTDVQVVAYSNMLDSVVRLTNECYYLVDFFNSTIPYISYSPLYLCGVEPEVVKTQINLNFHIHFASRDEIEMISERTRQWLRFLMTKELDERMHYSFRIDYHLNKKLICLSMIPVVFTPGGKPVIVLSKVSISPRTEAGNAMLFKKNHPNYWIYDNDQWVEQTHVQLSEMEVQILLLSVQGRTENEISELIFRSKDGLKTIKRKLFRKMGVTTITEAVSKAISYGLIG